VTQAQCSVLGHRPGTRAWDRSRRPVHFSWAPGSHCFSLSAQLALPCLFSVSVVLSGKRRPERRSLPSGLRQWPGSAGRPWQGQRGAGIPRRSARAFVMVPEPPPPPQASVSRSANPAAGIRRTPESARRPTPHRRCGGESGAPGGRAHVGLLWVRRLAEPGGSQGGPWAGTSTTTPRPKWWPARGRDG